MVKLKPIRPDWWLRVLGKNRGFIMMKHFHLLPCLNLIGLLAIVAYHDYEIWQMDVKTAFLNGFLKEEVYMSQPKGFESNERPNQVCKLKRFIYGLKQASRS